MSAPPLFQATIEDAREQSVNGAGTATELQLSIAYQANDGGPYTSRQEMYIPLPHSPRLINKERPDLIGKTLTIEIA